MGGNCECKYLRPLPTCDRIDNFLSTENWSPTAACVSSNCLVRLQWDCSITAGAQRDLKWSGHYRLLAVLLEYCADCSIRIYLLAQVAESDPAQQCRTGQTMGSGPALLRTLRAVLILCNQTTILLVFLWHHWVGEIGSGKSAKIWRELILLL